MKKTHVIAIVVIAIAFGVILTSLSSNSTYATFKEASASPNHTYHVVGKLDRSKPYAYDPHIDANKFTFYMIDKNGSDYRVTLNRPKPDDFEKSDQLVVIGKADSVNSFAAADILMKCPSKYTADSISTGNKKSM